MKITTKRNDAGRISAYFVDGVKTRKTDVESIIYNAAANEVIEIDYRIAFEFKSITRTYNRNLKLVTYDEGDTLPMMTEEAAKELGATIIKGSAKVFFNLIIYSTKMPAYTEANVEDYAVSADAQQVAIDAEIELANQQAAENIKVETKITIETKIAKNGAELFYLDGKRISAVKAQEIRRACIEEKMVQKVRYYINHVFDRYETENMVRHTVAFNQYEMRPPVEGFSVVLSAYRGYYCSAVTRTYKTIDEAINAVNFFNEKFFSHNNSARVYKYVDKKQITFFTLGYNGYTRFTDEYFALIAEEYAVTADAQDVAVDAEIELANEIATSEYDSQITVASAKAKGLSFEEFIAASNGMSLTEYNAYQANKTAEIERRNKIAEIKNEIAKLQYDNVYAAGNLNDIIINHYCPNQGYEDYLAELTNEIADRENQIAKLKNQLVVLEPVIDIAETDGSEEDDDEQEIVAVIPDDEDDTDDELIDAPTQFWVDRANGNFILHEHSDAHKKETDNMTFAKKLAELKANAANANAYYFEKLDIFHKLQAALREAERNVDLAFDKAHDAARALDELARNKAKELRDNLLDDSIFMANIGIINQQNEIVEEPQLSQIWLDYETGEDEVLFKVTSAGNTFGYYDTPEQVTDVINRLKDAIKRGDKSFSFVEVPNPFNEQPTREGGVICEPELTDDLADSLIRAMKENLERFQDFCRVMNLTAANRELELYQICNNALLRKEVA